MVLGAVPHDKICVIPNATLGFHAAYDLGINGRAITDPEAMMLYSLYPTRVQRWITARGGLSNERLEAVKAAPFTSDYCIISASGPWWQSRH
jgi:hypothetical protein